MYIIDLLLISICYRKIWILELHNIPVFNLYIHNSQYSSLSIFLIKSIKVYQNITFHGAFQSVLCGPLLSEISHHASLWGPISEAIRFLFVCLQSDKVWTNTDQIGGRCAPFWRRSSFYCVTSAVAHFREARGFPHKRPKRHFGN